MKANQKWHFVTVRRITALLVILQIAIVYVVADVLQRYTSLLISASLLVAMTLVGLLRFAIVFNNFRITKRYKHEESTEIDLKDYWAMIVREWFASMRASSWTMPFKSSTQFIHGSSDCLPVLLVHGYGCNSGYWHDMRVALTRERVSHMALDMTPVFGNLDAYAEQIDDGITLLTERCGASVAIIVAHSMGGLAARSYIRRYGINKLAAVITLGTPHHGTILARYSVGTNCAQMRRSECRTAGCQWLSDLAASECSAIRKKITSVYSPDDNIVIPATSSILEGATNIGVPGIGHVEMADHLSIQQIVIRRVQEISKAQNATRTRKSL